MMEEPCKICGWIPPEGYQVAAHICRPDPWQMLDRIAKLEERVAEMEKRESER